MVNKHILEFYPWKAHISTIHLIKLMKSVVTAERLKPWSFNKTSYLNCHSGERVSLAITMLLSMNVFMLLVQDMIPPTSDSVPLVAKYYTATTIGMSVGVIIACYNLRLYFIDPTFYKIPNWMKKYVLGRKQLLKLLKVH